jgi:hypothetical protein
LNVRIRVIALQTPPNVSSLYTNDRVFASRVVRRPPEELYPDEPFLEQIVVAGGLLVDNVLEKFLAAPAGPEMPAGYDPVQFFSDEIRLNRVLRLRSDGMILEIFGCGLC